MNLFGELDFRATPNRKNQKVQPVASRDEASLFLIPGLRLSLLPRSRVSPYLTSGWGLAVLEQSVLLQNGDSFPGSRVTRHLAWQYGSGVDIALWKWLGLRFDLRDFYADSRHNPILSGGFQLRIRSR
jgi:opacity protein-like surface antigen